MRVEAPCLDCGLPLEVEVRDGQILRADPEGLLGYVAVPYWRWGEDLARA